MRLRLHKRRDILLDYAAVINFSIPDECDTLRIAPLTGDLALNLTDDGASDGDYLKVIFQADGSARTVTIGGAQGGALSVPLAASGVAALYLVYQNGTGKYIPAQIPAGGGGGAGWPLTGTGTLTGNVTMEGADKSLTLGTPASKLNGFDLAINDHWKTNMLGNNNFWVGQNMSSVGGGIYFHTVVLGIDHILTTNGNIAWATVFGEANQIEVAATCGANNVAILGGYNNKVILSGAGLPLYAVTIVGGDDNIIEATIGSIVGTTVCGNANYASATACWVSGQYGRATAEAAFVHGHLTPGASVRVLGAGIHSINMGANSPAQTAGHGALANDSAIIGGLDANIPADSPRSVILGGNAIKARAADPDQVYVPNMNIVSAPAADNALTSILVRATNGQVKTRTIALVADRTLSISNPTGIENRTVFFTPKEITITQIDDVVVGIAPSVDWNISFSSTRNGAPTLLFNVDRTTNSEAGSSTNTFDNPVIPAGSWVWLTTSAISGTVASLDIQFTF